MAAAHAFEHEGAEHSPAPVEAVEQAEHGNVVYLTRQGRRVAALVPPHRAEPDWTQEALSFLDGLARDDPQRARSALVALLGTAGSSDSSVHQRFRDELADLLDDFDTSSRAADRLASHRAGTAQSVPHDEVVRRHW
jgi:antitoxin (DNA-binding transcriptional repressor) of toxin-antitoxin stability system